MLAFYDRHWPNRAFGVTSAASALPLDTPPFPGIFDTEKLNEKGHLKADTEGKVDKVSSVPMMTSWQSSKAVGEALRPLAQRMAKINLHKMHRFEEAGLEEDELREVVEDLTALYQCYQSDTDV